MIISLLTICNTANNVGVMFKWVYLTSVTSSRRHVSQQSNPSVSSGHRYETAKADKHQHYPTQPQND